MQRGKVYKHGDWWMFRYKVPLVVGDKKVWRDKYEKIAPLDQYASVAALEKDGLVPKAPDTANLTPQRTQLLSEFVEHIYFPQQADKLKASTQRSYRQVYDCYVEPRTKASRMCDFILPTAQKFLDGIAAEKTLSTSSFQKIKWFCVAVFDAARIAGAYDHTSINPFKDVQLPKNRRPKKAGRYATLDSVIAMLKVLKKTDAVAMRVVAVAAFSGLRKSEIQGLRWEDLRDGEIHVQRTAWRTTKVEEGSKTEASLGTVPILKVLRKHIEAHRDGFPSDGFVFVGEKMGKPLDLHNLANRVIRPALAAKNIPWCGWHGFRRGLASNLHALGVGDLDIMKIMRHSDVAVTRASYIKVPDAAKKAAMRKLDAALSARNKRKV
jgi:integrase